MKCGVSICYGTSYIPILTIAKFFRFFEEFDKQGMKFWGMTVQNKPNDFLDTDPNAFQKMNLNPEMQRFEY
jgi:lipopolysaccharide biosynthesis protein